MARVLVVDDDPLAARQVAQVLGEEMVHVVEVVTSATVARAMAADARFDAAVIGFRLGGVTDASELAAALRAKQPHLAVIVTTAAADDEGMQRARAAVAEVTTSTTCTISSPSTCATWRAASGSSSTTSTRAMSKSLDGV